MSQPQFNRELYTNEDGKLATFAWPGGYPVFYVTKDNSILCPSCANCQECQQALEGDPSDAQWLLVAADVNYEDDNLACDNCNVTIESAYGNEDESDA